QAERDAEGSLAWRGLSVRRAQRPVSVRIAHVFDAFAAHPHLQTVQGVVEFRRLNVEPERVAGHRVLCRRRNCAAEVVGVVESATAGGLGDILHGMLPAWLSGQARNAATPNEGSAGGCQPLR